MVERGVEALKIIDSGVAIDLLVTDVIMPLMGGKELSAQVLKRTPGTRVLFISGYSDDEVFPAAIPDDERYLLVKPCTAAQFSSKIRMILDARK